MILVQSRYRSLIPLAAAFALTGGPTLSAALSASQDRAALSMARQRHAAHRGEGKTDKSDSKSKDRHESQPQTSCLIAAGASKPADTQGSSAIPAIINSIMQGGETAGPRTVLSSDAGVAVSALHYPTYHSHAPPAHF